MENYQWAKTLDTAITVSDVNGVIIYMNEASKKTFAKYGDNLIGRKLNEFHGDRSAAIIEKLLATKGFNVYTIEKNGVQKLIKQSCWYDAAGELGGLVELSVVVPDCVPHYVR